MKLALVFVVAAVAAAQPTPTAAREIERARALLDSPRWVDKAWGAYLGAQLRSRSLNERIVEEFRTSAALAGAPAGTEEQAFAAVLFDAAIQSGATVPAPLLEPFAERWRDATTILLARDSANEDLLLKQAAEGVGVMWLAANNILAERRSQRWYDRLVADLGPTHRFTVTDLDYAPGFGGGIGGGACGDGGFGLFPGFPPTAMYFLVDAPRRDAAFLAGGPRNVYYFRAVAGPELSGGFGVCNGMVNYASMRAEYLAKLGYANAAEMGRLIHSETTLRFSTGASLSKAVAGELERQWDGIPQYLRTLEEQGLRAPSAPPAITVEIVDNRRDKSELLPTVALRYSTAPSR